MMRSGRSQAVIRWGFVNSVAKIDTYELLMSNLGVEIFFNLRYSSGNLLHRNRLLRLQFKLANSR